MESPSPTERRQAWVRTSRHWLTLEETDPQEPTTPSDTLPDDDVFLEGCCAGKIEHWLRGCGPEQSSEDPSHMATEPLLKASCSFEDDLSLGAEATVLNINKDGPETGTCPRLLPPPRLRQKRPDTSLPDKLSPPFVNLGNSMASSGLSSDTSKTASSVSEVLQLCTEDAEETLYQLGFGCDEPHAPARVPTRFFSFPSRLRGINFRLFLESQLRRVREEDPGLSLASRFRQVEVLTAMANAFYSLYSHVSRTPLQKLAPPEASCPSPAESKIGPRFFASVRSEPRSPVERFKDTVSKMCLYTGPSLSRKRNSLPDVVGMVIGSVGSEVAWDEARGGAEAAAGGDDEGTEPERAVGGVERGGVRETGAKRVTGPGQLTAVCQRWSDSGEFWPSSVPSPGSDRTGPVESLASCVEPHAPLPKVTQDVICPQIRETVRLAPFRSLERTSPPGAMEPPQACGRGAEPAVQNAGVHAHCEENKPAPDEGRRGAGVGPSEPPTVRRPLPSAAEPSPCRITVTGWEGDGAVGYAVAPGYGAVGPGWVAPAPRDSQNYLSPTRPPSLGQADRPGDQQANSFELEEVHSAGEGEDEAGQTDGRTVMAAAPLSASKRQRAYWGILNSCNGSGRGTQDVILRGDSLQSDSSGYAEEDCNPSSS